MMKRIIAVLAMFSVMMTLVLSTTPFSYVSVQAVSDESALKSAITNNSNIELAGNITVSGNWSSLDYNGTINGNGYMIIGLTTSLFNEFAGTAQNLGVVGADSFSGRALFAVQSSGQISSCFAYGSINYTGTDSVGGLIATQNNGSVTESFSCVNIVSTASTHCGGFIGKIAGGTITSCYSAGTIDCKTGNVAGFSNYATSSLNNAASDTYTTCQIKEPSPGAKPSGVNGVYDNQLSIVRENTANEGVKTNVLMSKATLSDKYAITSTAYPALKTFYSNIWNEKSDRVIQVSVAAASVSDIDASLRHEPDSESFYARMDYLTKGTYIDKTNVNSLKWSFSSNMCKIDDTVPNTSVSGDASKTSVSERPAATSSDLLRSSFTFSGDVKGAVLKAASAEFERQWYITASCNTNPYFPHEVGSGKDTSPFMITNSVELDYVRYYSLIDYVYYRLANNISDIGQWDSIDSFYGNFNGDSKTISSVELIDDGSSNIGLFGSTRSTESKRSEIADIILKDVSFDSSTGVTIGSLIGYAENTKVNNIILNGVENTLKSTGTIGGLIGKAQNCELSQLLVSVEIDGKDNCGAIVGYMNGGSLIKAGATGYVSGQYSVGGLIGQTAAYKAAGEDAGVNASVSYSYSTVAVFAYGSGTVNAGGLIGDAKNAVLNNSYCAALVTVDNATDGYGPFVGNGTIGAECYYDKNMSKDSTVDGAKTTKQLLGTQVLPNYNSTYWNKTNSNYPQLQCFSGQPLSVLSTTPVYYQRYWQDIESHEITTGWIEDAVGTVVIDEPTTLSAFSDDVMVYESASGWGFEVGAGVTRIALRAEGKYAGEQIGIRVLSDTRDSMQTITYTVNGVSGINTYLEIYYTTDDIENVAFSEWSGSQLMVVSGETTNLPLMYDIPKDCYIKAKVSCLDDYDVDTVIINGTAITATDSNGYYVSYDTYSNDVDIVVTMKEASPAWGVHRQTY